VTRFQHLPTPAELRACSDEPKLGSIKTDDQLADYVLDLKDAGADCRERLKKRNEVEDASG
jgi:hypothetical protein